MYCTCAVAAARTWWRIAWAELWDQVERLKTICHDPVELWVAVDGTKEVGGGDDLVVLAPVLSCMHHTAFVTSVGWSERETTGGRAARMHKVSGILKFENEMANEMI